MPTYDEILGSDGIENDKLILISSIAASAQRLGGIGLIMLGIILLMLKTGLPQNNRLAPKTID